MPATTGALAWLGVRGAGNERTECWTARLAGGNRPVGLVVTCMSLEFFAPFAHSIDLTRPLHTHVQPKRTHERSSMPGRADSSLARAAERRRVIHALLPQRCLIS